MWFADIAAGAGERERQARIGKYFLKPRVNSKF
jgi:hypothetical protein